MTSVEPQVADDGIYSTKEACEALGLSYKTLMARVEEGSIRTNLRIDGNKRPRRVFRGSEIKRYWRTIL